MKWVIDASVAAKWFNLEEFSEMAVQVKNAHAKGDLQLVAPIQMVYEVGNSIWKNPQINGPYASEAICNLLALHIELLEPTADDSPIAKFLAKKGSGIHHLCVEVDDLDLELKRYAEKGVRLINPEPVIGAGGCRVAFVHPKSTQGVLLELKEKA